MDVIKPFLEVSEEMYERIKDPLKNMNISVSDCTLPGDKGRHVHITFDKLSKKEMDYVCKLVDKSYGNYVEEERGRSASSEEKKTGDEILEVTEVSR